MPVEVRRVREPMGEVDGWLGEAGEAGEGGFVGEEEEPIMVVAVLVEGEAVRERLKGFEGLSWRMMVSQRTRPRWTGED